MVLRTEPARASHSITEPKGVVEFMDMNLLRTWLQARLHFGERDERGANLVEYILLIAFIAIIVIVAVKVLGRTVSTQFSSANSNLS